MVLFKKSCLRLTGTILKLVFSQHHLVSEKIIQKLLWIGLEVLFFYYNAQITPHLCNIVGMYIHITNKYNLNAL